MFSKYLSQILVAVIMAASSLLSLQAYGQLESGWKTHDLNRPAPKVVTPGEGAGMMMGRISTAGPVPSTSGRLLMAHWNASKERDH